MSSTAAVSDAAEITAAAEAGELAGDALILGGVGLADTIAGGAISGAALGGAAGVVLGVIVAFAWYEAATHL
jgi:hypothetical protein